MPRRQRDVVRERMQSLTIQVRLVVRWLSECELKRVRSTNKQSCVTSIWIFHFLTRLPIPKCMEFFFFLLLTDFEKIKINSGLLILLQLFWLNTGSTSRTRSRCHSQECSTKTKNNSCRPKLWKFLFACWSYWYDYVWFFFSIWNWHWTLCINLLSVSFV